VVVPGGVYAVDVRSAGRPDAVPAMDRTRELGVLAFDGTPAIALGGGDAADLVLDRAATLASAEMLGAADRVLAMTVDYAKDRVQFGKPIGSFQAVKHMLADVHVGLEFARPLVHGAALTLDPRDISAAKVACGDAAYRAARTGLQVHGAIGYTAEYDLAHWLVKIRALVNAWGTRREHRDRIRAAL